MAMLNFKKINEEDKIQWAKNKRNKVRQDLEDFLVRKKIREEELNLTEEQEKIICAATTFNMQDFPKIVPVAGTLAYFIKDLDGGTETVASLIDGYITNEKTNAPLIKRLREILILWRNADDNSRNRIDIFDILCKERELSTKLFWSVLQGELFEHSAAETKFIMSQHKNKLAKKVLQFANDKAQIEDRKLATKMTGLITDNPNIVIDNSTNTVQQNNITSSFRDILDRADKVVDEIDTTFDEVVESRQLTEGNSEFIDTNYIEESREKEHAS